MSGKNKRNKKREAKRMRRAARIKHRHRPSSVGDAAAPRMGPAYAPPDSGDRDFSEWKEAMLRTRTAPEIAALGAAAKAEEERSTGNLREYIVGDDIGNQEVDGYEATSALVAVKKYLAEEPTFTTLFYAKDPVEREMARAEIVAIVDAADAETGEREEFEVRWSGEGKPLEIKSVPSDKKPGDFIPRVMMSRGFGMPD